MEKQNQPCKFFQRGTCSKGSACIFSHVYLDDSQGWMIEEYDPCKRGDTCYNYNCIFKHPEHWSACPLGEKCLKIECTSTHPPWRSKVCLNGEKCWNVRCHFLHPPSWLVCEDEEFCSNYTCPHNHPPQRKLCQKALNCRDVYCKSLHPQQRKVCAVGISCLELYCSQVHPPGRPNPCPYNTKCWNENCTLLHDITWNPCPDGIKCTNVTCTCIHSPSRIISPRPSSLQFHPASYRQVSVGQLKTAKQRLEEREKANLPILKCYNQFCNRLFLEKVLIVTAETGSGKTTQLPQYATESNYFNHGLVVCTQPRVMAAISIAQRIAEEFDGYSVGESVGHQAGGHCVDGRRIMLMTDSALIRLLQNDPLLSRVSVLIIDEAHERSLNTDIVLGMAKIIRQRRPNDFFVVIASATIDPTSFLKFFGCSGEPLRVPGRVFPVSMEYLPPPSDIKLLQSSKLIDKFVIPSVIQTLAKYPTGHALVFLPGQGEIETALKSFSTKNPGNCVALPLFGALPPDDQDKVLKFDNNNNQLNDSNAHRMVAFCTNVAETSLTVPGVRLVIDTGLAKEARFDPKRRMTILELIRISRSSAEQRKGRAGRLSEGHCVRLYNQEDLTRQNIEPEILRFSLDTVILQLKCLGLDPMTFPFMDSPSQEDIRMSLKMLTDMNCLDSVGYITNRGKLFAEIPFDPRIGNFIVTCWEKHGQSEIGITMAAILSAPGTVFFMGGVDKNARALAKEKIASRAAYHDSDLLYLLDVFRSWDEAGQCQEGRCKRCKRVLPRFQSQKGCRKCRVEFALEQGLNNKVLELIKNTVETVTNLMQNPRWKLSKPPYKNADILDVIANSLETSFADQIGEVLVPQYAREGVCLLEAQERARIVDTSAFLQRIREQPFKRFVTMSITQLPSGIYVISNLHPLPDKNKTSKIEKEWKMVVAYKRNNLGEQFLKEINKYLNQKQQKHKIKYQNQKLKDWARWCVCIHDPITTVLEVHVPASFVKQVQDKIKKVVEKIDREMKTYEVEEILPGGTGLVVFQSGLEMNRFEVAGIDCRIRLQNLKIENKEEFLKWAQTHLKLNLENKDTVRWWNFQQAKIDSGEPQEAFAVLVLKTPQQTQQILNQLKTMKMDLGEETDNKSQFNEVIQISEENQRGRSLIVTTPGDVTLTNMKTTLENFGISILAIDQIQTPTCTLRISNLPLDFTQNDLTNIVNSVSKPKLMKMDIGTQTNTAYVIYHSKELRDQSLKYLEAITSQMSPVEITVLSKRNPTKLVQPEVTGLTQDFTKCTAKFRVVCKTPANAQKAYNQQALQKSYKICGVSKVTIEHSSLWPNLQELINNAANRTGVTPQKIEKRTKNKIEVRFEGDPLATASAASFLETAVKPIKLAFSPGNQYSLYKELHESGRLDSWANELGLKVQLQPKPWVMNFQLWGPGTKSGEFLRRVTDYWDNSFKKRYLLLDLDKGSASLLWKGSAGATALKEVAIQNQKTCLIQYIPHLKKIEICATPEAPVGTLDAFQKEVTELLMNLGGNLQQVQKKLCVFCNQRSTQIFTRCGHGYCNNCMSLVLPSLPLPLSCASCNTPIHVRDLRSMDRSIYSQLFSRSVRKYFLQHPNDQGAFCPVGGCNAVLSKDNLYHKCSNCSTDVCAACYTVNDSRHNARSCSEYKMFKKAEEKALKELSITFGLKEKVNDFVKANWSIDLPTVNRVDINPGLQQSPAIKRFLGGLERLGHSTSLLFSQGHFAWHGTTDQAIVKICQDGFKPTLRSGQAYGPGEYFGVTANVSHGYSKGGNRMIVAFLLDGPHKTTHNNFCYVVNNPQDWSIAFCLPVAVVSFGSATSPPNFLNTPQPDTPLTINPKDNWEAPFRWHWKDDSNSFCAYTNEINSILESYYDNWKHHSGPSKVVTPPINRYVDDIPQSYKIDLKNNIQKNCKTNYPRAISREKVSLSNLTKVRWYFYDNNRWNEYDPLDIGKIEIAYQQYCSGSASSRFLCYFVGRPELYELDFSKGIQKNTVSGAEKNIKKN